MDIGSFERELQALDGDLTIQPNPRNDKIAGVFYRGSYMFTVPNGHIYDSPNKSYGIETPAGNFVSHPTRPYILERVKALLHRLKNDKDYHDAFFGLGVYSDAELARGGLTQSGIAVPDETDLTKLIK